jgi:hypothetical protein
MLGFKSDGLLDEHDWPNLRIYDATGNWEAGFSGDGVRAEVTNWAEIAIDMAPFTGQGLEEINQPCSGFGI